MFESNRSSVLLSNTAPVFESNRSSSEHRAAGKMVKAVAMALKAVVPGIPKSVKDQKL